MQHVEPHTTIAEIKERDMLQKLEIDSLSESIVILRSRNEGTTVRNAIAFLVLFGLSLISPSALAEEPGKQFLDSVLVLRPGVADLGEMTVRSYVSTLEKASLTDGSNPKVVGWSRKNNQYTLRIKLIDQSAVLTFIHDLSSRSKGAVTLLSSVKADSEEIGAMRFTMMMLSVVPKEEQDESQAEETEIGSGDFPQGESSDEVVPSANATSEDGILPLSN